MVEPPMDERTSVRQTRAMATAWRETQVFGMEAGQIAVGEFKAQLAARVDACPWLNAAASLQALGALAGLEQGLARLAVAHGRAWERERVAWEEHFARMDTLLTRSLAHQREEQRLFQFTSELRVASQGRIRVTRVKPQAKDFLRCRRAVLESARKGYFDGSRYCGVDVVAVYSIINRERTRLIEEATRAATSGSSTQKPVKGLFSWVPLPAVERVLAVGLDRVTGASMVDDALAHPWSGCQKHPLHAAVADAIASSEAIPLPWPFSRFSTLESMRPQPAAAPQDNLPRSDPPALSRMDAIAIGQGPNNGCAPEMTLSSPSMPTDTSSILVARAPQHGDALPAMADVASASSASAGATPAVSLASGPRDGPPGVEAGGACANSVGAGDAAECAPLYLLLSRVRLGKVFSLLPPHGRAPEAAPRQPAPHPQERGHHREGRAGPSHQDKGGRDKKSREEDGQEKGSQEDCGGQGQGGREDSHAGGDRITRGGRQRDRDEQDNRAGRGTERGARHEAGLSRRGHEREHYEGGGSKGTEDLKPEQGKVYLGKDNIEPVCQEQSHQGEDDERVHRKQGSDEHPCQGHDRDKQSYQGKDDDVRGEVGQDSDEQGERGRQNRPHDHHRGVEQAERDDGPRSAASSSPSPSANSRHAKGRSSSVPAELPEGYDCVYDPWSQEHYIYRAEQVLPEFLIQVEYIPRRSPTRATPADRTKPEDPRGRSLASLLLPHSSSQKGGGKADGGAKGHRARVHERGQSEASVTAGVPGPPSGLVQGGLDGCSAGQLAEVMEEEARLLEGALQSPGGPAHRQCQLAEAMKAELAACAGNMRGIETAALANVTAARHDAVFALRKDVAALQSALALEKARTQDLQLLSKVMAAKVRKAQKG